MKLSSLSKQLTQDTNALEEMLTIMSTVKYIANSYGKKANTKSFLDIVQKTDERVYAMICLLVEKKHFSRKSIAALTRKVEEAYQQRCNIIYIKAPEKSLASLTASFENTKTNTTQKQGIHIKTAQTIYKRDTETDIEKLLA